MGSKLEGFPEQFRQNIEDAENNKRRHEYNPLAIYREEYIDPNYIDRTPGKEEIKDEHIHYVCRFLREAFKEGDVLNLGGGFPAYYHALLASDKMKSYTVIDISPKNLQLAKELLEGSLGVGYQEIAEKIDFDSLRSVANAFSKDPDYHFRISGDQMLKNVYAASQKDGKWDVIQADIIEQMEKIGSGKLVGGRKYDNIMLTFAIFARSRDELLDLLKNAHKRLKDNGRLIIMEYENFPGVNMESDQDLLYEDDVVEKKYDKVYNFSAKDLEDVLREAGFSIKHSGKVGDPDYEDGLGIYLTIIAEK